MDKAWIDIIKITGPVGVVALLLSLMMSHFFSEAIVSLLGSTKVFFIIVLIIFVLFFSLIFAIKNRESNSPPDAKLNTTKVNKKIEVKYDNGSTHNGDNKF
tara:strand:+ start:1985 stop:2287 length:303 start_codon:yes stop_codon:yes gene_type:complete